jgi:hypothetical protein
MFVVPLTWRLFPGVAEHGPAGLILAALIAVPAVVAILVLFSIHVPREPTCDHDLPGSKPPDIWGLAFNAPVVVLFIYVLMFHLSVSRPQGIWLSYAERFTRPAQISFRV